MYLKSMPVHKEYIQRLLLWFSKRNLYDLSSSITFHRDQDLMGEDANREDLLVPQMPHDPPGMGHTESRHGVLPAPTSGGRRGLPLHAAQDGDFLQGYSTSPVITSREED